MDYIVEQQIGKAKLIILKCDELTPNPVAHMTRLISKF